MCSGRQSAPFELLEDRLLWNDYGHFFSPHVWESSTFCSLAYSQRAWGLQLSVLVLGWLFFVPPVCPWAVMAITSEFLPCLLSLFTCRPPYSPAQCPLTTPRATAALTLIWSWSHFSSQLFVCLLLPSPLWRLNLTLYTFWFHVLSTYKIWCTSSLPSSLPLSWFLVEQPCRPL
jgi:hypothetical protein